MWQEIEQNPDEVEKISLFEKQFYTFRFDFTVKKLEDLIVFLTQHDELLKTISIEFIKIRTDSEIGVKAINCIFDQTNLN
jgi:hypothetical protein